MISRRLVDLLEEAVDKLRASGDWPQDLKPEIELSRPPRPEFGDFSTNLALVAGSQIQKNPWEVAKQIEEALPAHDLIERIEIAGPGFINFHLSITWLHGVIWEIAEQQTEYGRVEVGNGIRIQVEYGSANPTGPITVGNARNIVYGDALAALLEWAGFEVQRENYVNDAGGQAERFARSLEARYHQALGQEAEVPDDGYRGDYLIEPGKELAASKGEELVGSLDQILEWGLERMIDSQRKTLNRLGVHYDNWFSERSLHESGRVDAAIEKLRDNGLLYEKEAATWFKATDFGHHQDRVIIRRAEKGGRPTYRAVDAAYLLDKLERGFDRVIYFWGADHHGAADDLMALARALGVQEHVEIIIYQFVNFTGGRVSRRSGEFITLDEMLDEVGVDGTRFTFLTRSPDATFEFDFDLVKSQSQENPVYYVQYAHARIASILRKALKEQVELPSVKEAELDRLTHEAEMQLMRTLAELPEVIEVSASLRAPYRLTTYARTVAEQWHTFYENCRVIGDEPGLTQARLWLATATKQVLSNTLSIIGVSAPERM